MPDYSNIDCVGPDFDEPDEEPVVVEEYQQDMTDRQLERAGFQVRVTEEMPEHESEFIGPTTPHRMLGLAQVVELLQTERGEVRLAS